MTIGERSVIAAGAVVNKDVAPSSIIGGMPIKVLTQIFPGHFGELLKLKWWEWLD